MCSYIYVLRTWDWPQNIEEKELWRSALVVSSKCKNLNFCLNCRLFSFLHIQYSMFYLSSSKTEYCTPLKLSFLFFVGSRKEQLSFRSTFMQINLDCIIYFHLERVWKFLHSWFFNYLYLQFLYWEQMAWVIIVDKCICRLHF